MFPDEIGYAALNVYASWTPCDAFNDSHCLPAPVSSCSPVIAW